MKWSSVVVIVTLSFLDSIAGQEVTSPSSSIQSPLPTNLSCDGQLLHVDSCIKRAILFGDREALIPTTVQELESSHCERVKGELICIRSFGTTCLKLFPKTIFGLIRKNVEKVYKQLCRTQAGKERAIQHFKCFKPDNLPILHAVVDRMTMFVDFVANNATDDQLLPYLCCAFHIFFEDTKLLVDELCANITGKGTSEFILDIIRTVVTDAVDLGCGRYSNVQKCRENLPDAVRSFVKIAERMDEIPYSPIVPLIKITKRLDSGFK